MSQEHQAEEMPPIDDAGIKRSVAFFRHAAIAYGTNTRIPTVSLIEEALRLGRAMGFGSIENGRAFAPSLVRAFERNLAGKEDLPDNDLDSVSQYERQLALLGANYATLLTTPPVRRSLEPTVREQISTGIALDAFTLAIPRPTTKPQV